MHVPNNNPNSNPPRSKSGAQATTGTAGCSTRPAPRWVSSFLGLHSSDLPLWVSLHFVSTLLASSLWAPHSPRRPLAGPPTPVGPPTLWSSQSLSPSHTIFPPPFLGPLHLFDLPCFCRFPRFWGPLHFFSRLHLFMLPHPQWDPHPFSSSHNILASYTLLTSHTFSASHSLSLYGPWPHTSLGTLHSLGL